LNRQIDVLFEKEKGGHVARTKCITALRPKPIHKFDSRYVEACAWRFDGQVWTCNDSIDRRNDGFDGHNDSFDGHNDSFEC
jgi:hypothetical protein